MVSFSERHVVALWLTSDAGDQIGDLSTMSWQKKQECCLDVSFCLELLDEHGRHAKMCKVEGAAVHRHDTIRDGVVPDRATYFLYP